MPVMVNPNTGKPVDIAAAYVDRFARAGFKEQEPEVVEPVKADSAPAPRRGRPRKSE
jgi:hypothetical protein